MARSGHGSARKGYTLVEMLVATTLTLIMMGTVATVFGMIGEGISAARATLEMADALRATAQRLRIDLDGVTATMSLQRLHEKPGRPESGEGYFEYVEGPMGPFAAPRWVARNVDRPWAPPAGVDPFMIPFEPDTSVGDMDDVLLFTTRTRSEPFVGRYLGVAVESLDAEVAWFVRGRTLYRRVLLVRPDLSVSGPAGFFQNNDISVRIEGGNFFANSLADLTRPENRFAHQSGSFPFHPHQVAGWGAPGNPPGALARLNLPLLQECSAPTWVAGGAMITIAMNPNVRTVTNPNAPLPFDAWSNPHPWEPASGTIPVVDKQTGVLTDASGNPVGTRFGEDVILNNVIGFDVKAWDPAVPVRVIQATRAGVTTVTAVYPGDPPHLPETNNPNAPNFTGYAQVAARAGTTRTDNGATPPISYRYYQDLNGNGSFDWTDTNGNGRWDPGEPSEAVLAYGAYVDLGYGGISTFGADNYDAPLPPLSAPPPPNTWGPRCNFPYAANPMIRVYDTWSSHYENNGSRQTGNVMWIAYQPAPNNRPSGGVLPSDLGGPIPVDAGINGLDDDGNGLTDDPLEMETQAPYPVPLRGIQVKIRVFEPDSRQIREVTIVHSFLPL